ncbi:MAG TPA: PDR/VanB family oxidoreductase [Afipia sp.]
MEAGDILLVSDPKASFQLATDATRHVFIAGGIGITPFLPMLRKLKREGANFQIHYLAKAQESACFLAEVSQLSGERLTTYWSSTGERFQTSCFLDIGQDANTQIYCCGPKKLMDAVFEASTALAHPVRFETFAEASASAIYAGVPFEVQINSSGKIVPVAETQTMLEALRQSGHEIASSCEHGICGTCVIRVLKGNPVHRDGVLTDEMRKSLVAPCISRAKERLVLDL